MINKETTMKSKKFIIYTIIYTIAVFGLGVMIGNRYAKHHHYSSFTQKKEFKGHYKEKLSEDLNLSAEQKKQLDVILEKYHMDIRNKRKAVRVEFKEMITSMNNDISAILTEEQRIKFLELTEKHKNRFNHKERSGHRWKQHEE